MTGCCNCRQCCTQLVSTLFALGLVVLIYWAIFQPHRIRATINSATLSNLTVSGSGAAVSYRLAVSLNLYNPSRRVGIYYDALDAELRFRGTALGPAANGTSPAELYQRPRSGDDVKVDFEGSSVAVPGDVSGELEKERGQGTVSMEVAVDAQVRYRFSTIKIRQKPKIWCSLTIPVKVEGGGGAAGGTLASGQRCGVKY